MSDVVAFPRADRSQPTRTCQCFLAARLMVFYSKHRDDEAAAFYADLLRAMMGEEFRQVDRALKAHEAPRSEDGSLSSLVWRGRR
jgi:hypothetical protein